MAKGIDGIVLGQVQTLFENGAIGGLPDGSLLERFLADPRERGEAAFGVLVERHGPMVLGLCRRVLQDRQEAEDAFQATFLILARKAGSIRGREALGAWLFGVARKVAVRSKKAAIRRRSHQRRLAGAAKGLPSASPSVLDEIEDLLQEIERLPTRLRDPIVLCYLQGKTYSEAARTLQTTETTIRGRLARGRDVLRNRLTGRNVTVGGSAPAALGTFQAPPIPAPLLRSTIQAAAKVAAGSSAVGVATTPALSLMQGTLRAMRYIKIKTALAMTGLVAVLALGMGVSAQQRPEDRRLADPPRITAQIEAFVTAKKRSEDSTDRQEKAKAEAEVPSDLLAGRIVRTSPVTSDCMVLSYLPDWGFGNVDNIGVAGLDGGGRTLVEWPDIPASEARSPELRFFLAFYSRKTKANENPGPILAFELAGEWPERTSWRTQPDYNSDPVGTYRFEPGEGWKLFDITPLVRSRQGKAGHGLLIRFLREDRSPRGKWSGYQFVSREAEGELAVRRPVLLVIDPAKK